MKSKVINYLINEKENLNQLIEELVYPDYYYDGDYKPLSFHDLETLEKYRQEIYEIYSLISILNKGDKRND